MSKLLALPLFLVTLVSTAAHAPGQARFEVRERHAVARSGSTLAAKPGRSLAIESARDDDEFIDIGRWTDSTDSDRLAWNEFDFSTADFENPQPGRIGYGHARAWDEFPPDSLLVFSPTSGSGHTELARDALQAFDRLAMAESWGPGGSASSSSRSSSSESSGKSPVRAPDSQHQPVTDTATGSSTDEAPAPGETRPVNVPEPAALGLFGLGLMGMRLARRRRSQ